MFSSTLFHRTWFRRVGKGEGIHRAVVNVIICPYVADVCELLVFLNCRELFKEIGRWSPNGWRE